MGSDAFIKAVARRRSIYALGKDMPRSQQEVVHMITAVARHMPSSFNGQSCRLVILFNDQHERFWDEVKKAIRKVTSDEQYAVSEKKVRKSMQSGAGTVLFYIDTGVVQQQQKAHPLYAKNFPLFAQQSSAITQYAVWTVLYQDGIGASLQHYNELISSKAREMFNVPASWQMTAQMPFGSIKGRPHEKTVIPDESRVIVQGLNSKL